MITLFLTLIRNVIRLLLAPIRLLRRARAAPTGGWVHLTIDGPLVDVPRPRPRLPFQKVPNATSLYRLNKLADAILADESPRGLFVIIKSLRSSAATRTALRAILARVRDGGRQVVVHLPSGGSSAELLVASAASRILLGARTALGPLGFRVGSVYARKALDRAGVVPDVHAQGAYKTAGEGLMRDTMSEAQREQLGRLLDVLHAEVVAGLAAARKLPEPDVAAFFDRGLVTAEDAVAAGIADRAIFDDEAIHFLEGERSEKRPALIPAGAYLQRRTEPLFLPVGRKRRVGVIEVHGAIVDVHAPFSGPVADAERIVDLLRIAEDDPHIAALVLHVDSPGGGVLASDRIHRAVQKVAEKKPVVAYMSGVAASGGYYVSAPAHAIVAQPTTITGSIGVVAARVVIGPLLEKIGLTPQHVVRGAHADILDMTRPFEEDEKRIFEGYLEGAYRDFVGIVATGRKKSPEDILPLAGGRVWSGKDAHERGLVDQLGGFDVALADAKKRASLDPDDAPILLAPKTPWNLGIPFFAPGAEALETVLDRLGLLDLRAQASLLLASREKVLALFVP